eukprot:6183681-Pleurochrysis_carterae.AAC.2
MRPEYEIKALGSRKGLGDRRVAFWTRTRRPFSKAAVLRSRKRAGALRRSNAFQAVSRCRTACRECKSCRCRKQGRETEVGAPDYLPANQLAPNLKLDVHTLPPSRAGFAR